MPPSDLVRLRHMIEAAREAVGFAAGRGPGELSQDRVLVLALIECIEIVGEAASKISRETQAQFDAVPWADIIGMRNHLIHAYFDVDLDRVCDTIVSDLPPLIETLERIIVEAKQ